MKPKEGTILTVARGIADKAAELAEETEDLEEFIPALLEAGEMRFLHQYAGDAPCIERGRSGRFRWTGTDGSDQAEHMMHFLAKRLITVQLHAEAAR